MFCSFKQTFCDQPANCKLHERLSPKTYGAKWKKKKKERKKVWGCFVSRQPPFPLLPFLLGVTHPFLVAQTRKN